MPKITINLSESEANILKKRAKKNIFTLREQIEDIIRRSCANYKWGSKYSRVKTDDRLIQIFSREFRGRKSKKKKNKK